MSRSFVMPPQDAPCPHGVSANDVCGGGVVKQATSFVRSVSQWAAAGAPVAPVAPLTRAGRGLKPRFHGRFRYLQPSLRASNSAVYPYTWGGPLARQAGVRFSLS